MANIDCAEGFVNCGDTYVALDLEAFPGFYARAAERVRDMNERASQSGEGGIFTFQDAVHALIQESFPRAEAA